MMPHIFISLFSRCYRYLLSHFKHQCHLNACQWRIKSAWREIDEAFSQKLTHGTLLWSHFPPPSLECQENFGVRSSSYQFKKTKKSAPECWSCRFDVNFCFTEKDPSVQFRGVPQGPIREPLQIFSSGSLQGLASLRSAFHHNFPRNSLWKSVLSIFSLAIDLLMFEHRSRHQISYQDYSFPPG